MQVLVTGGQGTLGRLLAPRLQSAGHDVVVTSRKERTPPTGVELRVLDLSSGTMSSEFFIVFEANMTDTGDLFFVDDIKIVTAWEP